MGDARPADWQESRQDVVEPRPHGQQLPKSLCSVRWAEQFASIKLAQRDVKIVGGHIILFAAQRVKAEVFRRVIIRRRLRKSDAQTAAHSLKQQQRQRCLPNGRKQLAPVVPPCDSNAQFFYPPRLELFFLLSTSSTPVRFSPCLVGVRSS